MDIFSLTYEPLTPMPQTMEDETLEHTRRRYKWDNDNYICRGCKTPYFQNKFKVMI